MQGKRLTANDEGFCSGGGALEDAYWLLVEFGGSIQLFEVHLADDDWSPSGYCWDCYAYALRVDGQWDEIDGGQWWDYSDAGDLLAEFPGDYDVAITLSEEDFEAARRGFTLRE